MKPVCIGQQTEEGLDMFGVEGCPSVVALTKDIEGGQDVEDEDGGPAEEEEEHDEDQHVDHLPSLLLSTHHFIMGRDVTW